MKVQLLVCQREVNDLGIMGGVAAAVGYSTEYIVTAPSVSSQIRVVGGDKEVAIEKAKAALQQFLGKAYTVEVDI